MFPLATDFGWRLRAPAFVAILAAAPAIAQDHPASAFREKVKPILVEHCYACHADGAAEGQVSLDGFADADAAQQAELWLRVLRNVRAGIMPPAEAARLSDDERATLEEWIKYQAIGIDPADPDPGQVTLRRLNRLEYRNTIRDLFGYDYKTTENFPADDTGHGFDNIGELLSTSPLLIEKYLQAATEIVQAAVPGVTRSPQREALAGTNFFPRASRGRRAVDSVSCSTAGRYARAVEIRQPGEHRTTVEFRVVGQLFYGPGQARIRFLQGEEELYNQVHGWEEEKNGLRVRFEKLRTLRPGKLDLAFEVEPLDVLDDDGKPVRPPFSLTVVEVCVEGPLEESQWRHPDGYERFFHRDAPPEDAAERRLYAAEILQRFGRRAFRRPVDADLLDRLVDLAEAGWRRPGATFEEGIQQAITAILCSQRFLFRVEQPLAEHSGERFPLLDEYSLATRLSYLLWCSTPDDELLDLAERGELRAQLGEQVSRMLADSRSESFIESFVGQWLRTREVDTIPLDQQLILTRDLGLESQELNRRAAITQRIRELAAGKSQEEATQVPPPVEVPKIRLDKGLREAMRGETEHHFAYIIRENRPLTELIDSDYTFLNDRLAEHYGIEGVEGEEFRKVELAPGSRRGGVLKHAGILAVTSQSTRTSPVKRGTFVLDNLLGTPPPPAPPNIPSLDRVDRARTGQEPTLRESLEMHRQDPVCASCHRRMDPIGLALENYNALGMWRDGERNQPIDPRTELITGESIADVDELCRVLVTSRRADFYHCLSEKLLIYALGRGLRDYDVEAIDRIVQRIEHGGGSARDLLLGVMESVPFQKCRNPLSLAGAP